MGERRGDHRWEWQGEREGERRLHISEAAKVLGISKDAVRMRVKRGTLRSDKDEDGRVYIYLNEMPDGVPHGVPHGVRPELQAENLLIAAKDETIRLLSE